MPLFDCSQCGTVDNTALTDYWTRVRDKQPPLCSACLTGEWHGVFERHQPAPNQELLDWRARLNR